MRAALCAAVLLFAGPSQAADKAALLWVPPEGSAFWEGLAQALAKDPRLKLTVALVAEGLPPAAEEALTPLIDRGQVEVALRIPGDPILPMIASRPEAPRPQDIPARLATAREAARLVFGVAPSGFCPGGGAVSPELFEDFGSQGLSWVATGDYEAGTGAWTASGTVVLVPFRPAGAPGREVADEDLAPGMSPVSAFVLDETGGRLPPGAVLRFLERAASGLGPARDWVTVREAVEAQRGSLTEASTVSSWPTWSGGLEAWSSAASQGAWTLYGETAAAIERYQNSGSAGLADLEKATDALYQAQAGDFYRDPASGTPAEARRRDKRLRARLIAVYRRLKQAPPESLFPSREAAAIEPSGEDEGPAERSTGARFTQGGTADRPWISFENPAAPPPRRGSPAEQAAAYALRSLRVDWDGEKVVFAFRAAPPPAGKPSPLETGDLRLEAYIDLNGVLGAGSIALLEAGHGFIRPRDAWEYALSAAGAEAKLWRSAPQGPPSLVAKLPASADPRSGEVRVAVPRALLKGHPARWGFVVLSFPAAAGSAPASLLGSAEDQRSFFKSGPGQGRLTAVRAPRLEN